MNVIKGDLLNASRGVIIHGCNAQGVMGSGVARGVRDRFPRAYEIYAKQHALNGLHLGSCIPVAVSPELWVVNAITQGDYGSNGVYADYTAIELCFDWTAYFLDCLDRTREPGTLPYALHMPKIGAGRAGGDWARISQIIDSVVPATREVNLYVVDEEPAYCR